jgi:hypothetical protein
MKPAFLTLLKVKKGQRGRGAEEQRGKNLYNNSPLLPYSTAPLHKRRLHRDVVRNPGEGS